jgi:hypothetical protein
MLRSKKKITQQHQTTSKKTIPHKQTITQISPHQHKAKENPTTNTEKRKYC